MQAQMETKNCVVTGANSGIGFAITEGFASRLLVISSQQGTFERALVFFFNRLMYIKCKGELILLCVFSGATVYMVCRNKERGEAALSKIKSATGNKNVYLEVVGFLFFAWLLR